MQGLSRWSAGWFAVGVVASIGWAHAQEEAIKLGVSEPLSGPASSLGIPVVESIKTAAEFINANGGVNGRKIELLIRDDQSRADVAVQNFRRLAEEGVYGVIGPNQGSNALAVAPVLLETKVPMCGFQNTISITKLDNPYIFRCQTSDTDNTRAALKFASEKLGAKNVAVLYTGDAYGTEAYAALEAEAKEMNIPIVAAEKINYGASDTTAEWTKVLSAQPEAIILWGSGSTMSVALRNGSQLGNTAPIIGAQGVAAAAIIKSAGAAAEGVYMVTLNAPDQVTPEQQELSRIYKERHGEDYALTIYDIIGWDAVHIYAEAIRQSGGDKAKVVEGMEKTQGLKLAGGSYTYTAESHEGLGSDSVWIVQVKDGATVGVQRGF
ncbi:Leucine-, isoleucine-, valine-, threonine-, and alanine-binding protein [Ensifer psoraleae]|uniref:ABC transporter substrate-binding protein n=1 Tax=Sinorhizobium psoraleae TaxID=520838 RepID=UPI00156933D9|nr:ABC transporter substrate-binding protein [Sinorhizobium psoraleae]NRP72175.1 Leucine-, isoleucine-, valine-, threonine-, and alanine-binding protein [Sinorhizobium psoraleae]